EWQEVCCLRFKVGFSRGVNHIQGCSWSGHCKPRRRKPGSSIKIGRLRGRPKVFLRSTISLLVTEGIVVQHSPEIVVPESWHSAHGRIGRRQQRAILG